MAKVTINHNAFEYVEYGSGQPVLFVHGSASDYRTWQNQLENFSKCYRAIAYSRRYHWPNKQISAQTDYSMLEQADDLQEFIRALDVAPVRLVGHSYGAFLCLLVAISEPALVRSLVLAEPPVITLFVSNTPKPLEILKLLVTRPRTAIAILKFGVNAVAPATKSAKHGDTTKAMHLFGKAILGNRFYNNLSRPRVEQVDANAIKAEFLGSGFATLDADQIANIRQPTLLITGRFSHCLFHRLTDRLKELLPTSTRIEIPEASHIMHEDNAPAYNQAVQSFWDRND